MDEFETLVLKNGHAELVLRPTLGGAVQALNWHGHEILRSAGALETDITAMASFPMVPVVNRIPDGQFEFDGYSVTLEPNSPDSPDFNHGYGWKRPWVANKQENSEAVLSLLYTPGNWPWTFEACQRFRLEENALWSELSVTNKSNFNMPAALGFHPFFPTTPQTRLKAKYEGYWESNERQHALRRVLGSTRKDFNTGANFVDTDFLDATHYNWKGAAILSEDGRPTIKITASPKAKHLHIYYLPDGKFVAIEPTSGRSNMFAVPPRDYEVLVPGQTFSIWMKIEIEQSAGS